MVAYATVVWLVSLVAVMFVYTFTWDLYVAFWEGAMNMGVNAAILNYLYAIHQWLPIAFLFSTSFWFLVEAQRRTNI